MDNIFKVSVIIPVYNAAEFLEQGLDSLLNQTLHDIEIICVNDGSSDKSLEILKEYEKKDGLKSIEIISEEISEDGNTATVKIKQTYGNGETQDGTQSMVKRDGKWLMSVDK